MAVILFSWRLKTTYGRSVRKRSLAEKGVRMNSFKIVDGIHARLKSKSEQLGVSKHKCVRVRI